MTTIDVPSVGKRDLAGFDRALTYAEAALVKGPKVQLGTGAEGSGVGIIVDNNPTAAARPGKGVVEGGAPAAKRDVEEASAPRRRAKVTTMYVRRGVPSCEYRRSLPIFPRVLLSRPLYRMITLGIEVCDLFLIILILISNSSSSLE